MAMYRCEECEQLINDDYSPCVEHPTQAEAYCCEECADKIEAYQQKEYDYMKACYDKEVISGLKRYMK